MTMTNGYRIDQKRDERLSKQRAKYWEKKQKEDERKEAERIEKELENTSFEVASHFEILDLILKDLKKIDFFKEAQSIEDNEGNENFTPKNLKDYHYYIISINKLLEIFQKKNWHIIYKDDFIYMYNGEYWTKTDSREFKIFLDQAAEKFGVPQMLRQKFEMKDKFYKQFISSAYLIRGSYQIDKSKILINLKNGTFEISPNGYQLREFKHEDFLRYKIEFPYEVKAEAPIFKKYLEKVLPDESTRNILAEFMGYVFIRHGSNLKLEKALVLYGSGSNGKSVFFEIINALLGKENLSNFSLSSLTDSNGYYRAKLEGKLVNYASEINGKLETSIFKQLVSGEPVEARLPYGEPFQITDYAKLIFNCNELPKEIEQTHAYFRRFLIIPFNVTIEPNEMDRELHSKIIKNELPGVLNWILEGLQRVLKNKKFSDCEISDKALSTYQNESDSVLMFLNENGYQVSSKLIDSIYLADMYFKEQSSSYKWYCVNHGFAVASSKTFSDRVLRWGKGKIKKHKDRNGILLQGIKKVEITTDLEVENNEKIPENLPF